MSYPLTLRFKVLAIARQLSVLGSDGRLLMYAKMKAFKLKESITVFADEGQTKPLYHVEADRIIDFAATYSMSDASGAVLIDLQFTGQFERFCRSGRRGRSPLHPGMSDLFG